MWIKSELGEAINMAFVTRLECLQVEGDQWTIIAHGPYGRFTYKTLGTYDDETEARRDFAELLAQIETFQLKPFKRVRSE